jgi:transcriptional regulator with XRE-family HTH domain
VKIPGSHSFGKEVKGIREFLGLSQVELAKRAQITPAALSQLEKGSREPAIGSILRLADALNVSTDRLLRGIKK